MLLADKLIQRSRPHTIGKRPGAVAGIFFARNVLKKAHTLFHHRVPETRRKMGIFQVRQETQVFDA